MTIKKERLFSVTKDDFDWDYYRGSGKGGQKKNKTSSAVRCTHRESLAVGTAEDTRSQIDNKKLAFERCVATEKFKAWLKLEISRCTGEAAQIEAEVNKSMSNPSNFRYEVFDTKTKHWNKVEVHQ